MKKILILSLALGSLFSACKKSSSGSAAALSATINGTGKNFVQNPLAAKTVLSGVTSISIVGAVNATTGESVNITINNFPSQDSLVPGTYSDTSSRFDLNIDYIANVTSGDFYTGGTVVDGYISGVTGLANHFKLVISSIGKTSIQGTFSGNIYLNGDPTATPWPVTGGSFNLKMITQ